MLRRDVARVGFGNRPPPGVTQVVHGVGMLPWITIGLASCLGYLAVADVASRGAASWADLVFWLAVAVMVFLVTARLLSKNATYEERLATVVVFGMALYAVKVLHSPAGFTFFDEFSHMRTAEDILISGRLYSPNPLAEISPLFPGLQIISASISTVTGVPTYVAGVLVIAAARFVLLVMLFVLLNAVSGSSRVAGVGSLLYMANPNFLFFSAQFSYESLSIPLAVMAATVLLMRSRAGAGERRGLTFIAALLVISVVVTHHLTAYAFIAFLVTWWIVGKVTKAGRSRGDGADLLPMILLALAAELAWLALAAAPTLPYLRDALWAAGDDMFRLITGQSAPKQLFATTTGVTVSIWERAAGYAAVALILLALPFGMRELIRHYRLSALAMVLGLGAAAYPASLALRWTQGGTETSNRASEFLFLGIALVVGLALTHPRLSKARLPGHAIAATVLVTIFVGGITIGTAPYARVPGPFLVGEGPRSVERQGISAARWANEFLGPQRVILTDRTNRQLMGAYGRQNPQVRSAGPIAGSDYTHVSQLIFSPDIGPAERAIVANTGLEFVVLDYRLTTDIPSNGIYFEKSEPGAYQHRRPMLRRSLDKFDHRETDRIFDSGDVVIYDIRGLDIHDRPG